MLGLYYVRIQFLGLEYYLVYFRTSPKSDVDVDTRPKFPSLSASGGPPVFPNSYPPPSGCPLLFSHEQEKIPWVERGHDFPGGTANKETSTRSGGFTTFVAAGRYVMNGPVVVSGSPFQACPVARSMWWCSSMPEFRILSLAGIPIHQNRRAGRVKSRQRPAKSALTYSQRCTNKHTEPFQIRGRMMTSRAERVTSRIGRPVEWWGSPPILVAMDVSADDRWSRVHRLSCGCLFAMRSGLVWG